MLFRYADGEPFDELENMIQMWLESYNTYHLIDGAAMKEVWGAIMPHIIYSPKNLEAILDQVKWALDEDALKSAMLSPRMRRIRLRGGMCITLQCTTIKIQYTTFWSVHLFLFLFLFLFSISNEQGASEMITGVNTEFLDSEFSLVNVREAPAYPYRGGGMRY